MTRIVLSQGRGESFGSIAKRQSMDDPDTIFVRGRNLMRDGVVVNMTAGSRRLFLILACRQHRYVPNDEITDILWGEEEDGGPLASKEQIRHHINALRDAAAALGFRVDSIFGGGPDAGYIMIVIPRRKQEIAA